MFPKTVLTHPDISRNGIDGQSTGFVGMSQSLHWKQFSPKETPKQTENV